MKRVLLVVVLMLFVSPVQAGQNKEKESPLLIAQNGVEKPFGFLPPPPPLPGMSRGSQQEIVDRYYRKTEPERYQDRRDDDDHHDHYSHEKGKKKKHLPPGLKKKEARGKELPPGWRKKIARGEVLDRDLRGHCQELPRELRSELPPPPRGTKFLQLEDRIIRVVESTFEIVDVFTSGR